MGQEEWDAKVQEKRTIVLLVRAHLTCFIYPMLCNYDFSAF
jgi:hypothetical protein